MRRRQIVATVQAWTPDYAVSLLVVVAVGMVKWRLTPMHEDAPFLLWEAAIGLAAWHGGIGPGIAATITAGALVYGIFLPHTLEANHVAALIDLTTFVAGGVFLSTLFGGRKRAWRMAREAQERCSQILENTSDGIVTIDQDGQIIAVNPAAVRIFGYTERQMVGLPVASLMPEIFRPVFREGLAHYLATGKRGMLWSHVFVPGKHQTGHEMRLEMSYVEHHDDGKRLFSAIIREKLDAGETEGVRG